LSSKIVRLNRFRSGALGWLRFVRRNWQLPYIEDCTQKLT
jgi:hypothetical protein